MKRRVVEMPPAQEPKITDPYEAALLNAQLGGQTFPVELHGLSKDEALKELETSVYRFRPPGVNVLKISHGRGTGTLHEAVHDWLKKHPELIAKYEDAGHKGLAGGVTYAVLKD